MRCVPASSYAVSAFQLLVWPLLSQLKDCGTCNKRAGAPRVHWWMNSNSFCVYLTRDFPARLRLQAASLQICTGFQRAQRAKLVPMQMYAQNGALSQIS